MCRREGVLFTGCDCSFETKKWRFCANAEAVSIEGMNYHTGTCAAREHKVYKYDGIDSRVCSTCLAWLKESCAELMRKVAIARQWKEVDGVLGD